MLQLNLEKKERQDLASENMRLLDESNKLRKDLKAELAVVQAELIAANDRKQIALEVEAKAKGQIEAHQKTAHEAREKYETELKLHSQDVEVNKLIQIPVNLLILFAFKCLSILIFCP